MSEAAAPAVQEAAPSGGEGLLADAIASAQPPEELADSEVVIEGDGETLEVTETKEEPEEKPAANTKGDFEDFSDDKPWTPERIKNAAGKAKEMLRTALSRSSQVVKREEKLKADRQEHQRQVGLFKVARDTTDADLRALRSGDAATTIAALGRLMQTNGLQAYNDLSLHIAKNGKKPEQTEAEATRAELAEVKKKLEAKEQREAVQAQIAETRAEIAHLARDGEKWPNVAKALEIAHAKGKGAEFLATIENLSVDREDKGAPIDIARIRRHHIPASLNELELYLRNNPELLQPAAGEKSEVTVSGTDTGRDTRADAKPETAPRTPGKSLTPSLATSAGGAQRALTSEERDQELIDDPDFLKELFPGLDL